MQNFVRKLLTEWRRLNLPFDGETFIIAVSGGADSVGLLLAINDLRERKKMCNRFVVAHFNHDLRASESEKDAEFVKSLCEKFNFELVLKTQDSEFKIRDQKGNIEQNARRARYAFLRETAENLKARGVLTAHTMSDQAETFLLNLVRGSGLQGLSAMNAVRVLDEQQSKKGGEKKEEKENFQSAAERLEQLVQTEIRNLKSEILLIRPLLNWAKRIETENFCHLNDVEYRRDAMNEDLTFSRVRVRKILLPLLAEFNPKIVETLANTAKVLRGANELIDDETRRQRGEEREKQTGDIALKKLRDLPESKLNGVVRQWLNDNSQNPRGIASKHVAAVARLVASRKSGKTIELPNGESVEKQSGILIFKNSKVEK